jgi:hypothetical protein
VGRLTARPRGYRRTGWIEQLTDVTDDDGSGREFDRFACRWEGAGPADFHMRHGPACVSLDAALAWCAEHTGHAFLNGFGNARWSIGKPADRFPPLPPRPPVRPLSWEDHVAGTWDVEVELNLGLRDYDQAAPGFELALRAGPFGVRRVERDDVGARLHAVLSVAAPTQRLAAVVAGDEARRAASDLPDGLLDEQADCFGLSSR